MNLKNGTDATIDAWDVCEHQWSITPGDWDLGDVPGMGAREDVTCVKCQCPGERYVETGEVDWPTT
jgi:hypothetical protein